MRRAVRARAGEGPCPREPCKLWGHPMGRTAAMRRAENRKITTLSVTRVRHPPFGHHGFATRQSFVLPQVPRPHWYPSGIRGVRPEGPVASEWDSWDSTRGPSGTHSWIRGVRPEGRIGIRVGFDPTRCGVSASCEPPIEPPIESPRKPPIESPIEAACKLHPPRNRAIT